MLFGDEESLSLKPIIKVVGVGGAGGNAVDRMIDYDVRGVEFVAINTDVQDLKKSKADVRIVIGRNSTRGKGAGAKPEVGRNAALEDEDAIREAIDGADMVFITCGMGGGTGTGAAPVVARICRELGALTVGIVTKPFLFERQQRMDNAIMGIEELRKYVDALILIPNERLFQVVDAGTSYLQAFREVDDILRQGVQGISEIINFTGTINIDFADVKTVMKDKGTALMGIGVGKGPGRAIQAARNAIHSNLLEVSIDGATDAIVNIASSEEATLYEIREVLDEISSNCDGRLNVIHGSYINNDLGDEMVVTIIATGDELKTKENGIENLASEIFSDPTVDNLNISSQVSDTDDEDEIDVEKDGGVNHLFMDKKFEKLEKKRLKKEAKEEKKGKKAADSSVSLPSWLKK